MAVPEFLNPKQVNVAAQASNAEGFSAGVEPDPASKIAQRLGQSLLQFIQPTFLTPAAGTKRRYRSHRFRTSGVVIG